MVAQISDSIGEEAEDAVVWRAIAGQISNPTSPDQYASVGLKRYAQSVLQVRADNEVCIQEAVGSGSDQTAHSLAVCADHVVGDCVHKTPEQPAPRVGKAILRVASRGKAGRVEG